MGRLSGMCPSLKPPAGIELKMSQALAYHPPTGTKWKWGTKPLNYSPWICNLLAQKECTDQYKLHPLSCTLYVDLIDGKYLWQVNTLGFDHVRRDDRGFVETALEACTIAEAKGEDFLRLAIPDWARTAIANGWRPPA